MKAWKFLLGLSPGTARTSGMRTSVATSFRSFGAAYGSLLKTRCAVYLGSLGGDRLASFRSEVAGHQLAHWQFAS